MLWYSLEAPRRGASNGYTQYMFLFLFLFCFVLLFCEVRENMSTFRSKKKIPYLELCSTFNIKSALQIRPFLGNTKSCPNSEFLL